MATTLTAQNLVLTGLAATLAAADATGNNFLNTGREVFVVRNGGGSQITVTVAAQTQCNQGILHNETITVAAGATSYIGTFPAARFNTTSGYVNITYSGVASVTVAVIRV
jgi:hypothetical protein